MKHKLLALVFSVGMTVSLASCGAQGPKGDTGEKGEPGKNGIPGKDGHTPEITIGENGNRVIDGIDSGVSTIRKDKFIVTYNLEGGYLENGNDKAVVTWGDTLKLPVPLKKGHIFKGWFTGKTINDKQFFSTDAVFSNISLYAKWEVGTYKVTLDLNGGTYPGSTEYTYKYGDNYKLPDNIYKKGFIFEGWSLNGKLVPLEGVFNYENITLKAKYLVAMNHTIKLNLNGGIYDGPKEINVQTNSEYMLPREGVKNGNLVLVGWFYGYEKRDDKGIYTLNEDVTLAAKREALDIYNLTIDYNGGTGSSNTLLSISNKDLYEGKNIFLPKPTKNGYEFYAYTIGDFILTKPDEPLNIDVLRYYFKTNKELTLTAKYIGIDENYLGDYCYFGSYPQSKVKDTTIINSLQNAVDTDGDGFLNLDNAEYLDADDEYGNPAFFKVEPICRKRDYGTLVSAEILDAYSFYSFYKFADRVVDGINIKSNNYKYSSIRAFLNGYDGSSYKVENFKGKGFYDLAFTSIEKHMILESTVVNDVLSTGDYVNPYACENTEDKIFLLSELEARGHNYSYTDRIRRATDYAIAKFKYTNTRDKICGYWTRSPADDSGWCAYYITSNGLNHIPSDVDGKGGVLPAFKISE